MPITGDDFRFQFTEQLSKDAAAIYITGISRGAIAAIRHLHINDTTNTPKLV